jgi:hypothetical protein
MSDTEKLVSEMDYLRSRIVFLLLKDSSEGSIKLAAIGNALLDFCFYGAMSEESFNDFLENLKIVYARAVTKNTRSKTNNPIEDKNDSV